MTTFDLIQAEISKIPANRWDDLYAVVRVFAENQANSCELLGASREGLSELIQVGTNSGPGIPAVEVFAELRALAQSLAGSSHEA